MGEAAAINPWWVDWFPDGQHLALSSANQDTAFWVLENFFKPAPAEP